MQPWFTVNIFDIGHQFTPVKTSHLVTSLTWPYHGLRLNTHGGHGLLSWPLPSYRFSIESHYNNVWRYLRHAYCVYVDLLVFGVVKSLLMNFLKVTVWSKWLVYYFMAALLVVSAKCIYYIAFSMIFYILLRGKTTCKKQNRIPTRDNFPKTAVILKQNWTRNKIIINFFLSPELM